MYDLTIAIPTIGRSEHLEKMLNKLIPACYGNNIEVLVSDNASVDGTKALLNNFKKQAFFRSLRSENHLSFDENVLKLLGEVRGKFVWLLGDDDDIDFLFFDQIIDLVRERSDIGIFFLSFIYPHKNAHKKEENSLKIEEISSREYLDVYLHKATLISSNIINMKYFYDIKLNSETISKEWIQVQILIKILELLNRHKKNVLIVKTEVIFPAVGNTNYSFKKFWSTFVDQFSFVVDRSSQSLDLVRFKKNFYRLNLRRRFLTIGRDFCWARVFPIYKFVAVYFYISLYDKILFWLSFIIFRVFSYSSLKKMKDFVLRERK
ncbi:hypothetical protein A2230_00405 [candidate division WOR-1 bacterium RIFOXYA2_FULL_36_21]|uniref:Glycosyltransferase 2-like domain-containing protein n=1 Tax=candidate division WOR-1 bacterium RIFOXYB2_FULL_36_35 TaxID=1802578 RepID=A0A1F4S5F2_UNCSA|nr:MAG: hypothetical protein A2230_00405 [candidate division WOR-1 bacterium RIFOXYA2_FULL_36_21]OGC15629.1 MAG: hypothetical protein A2290_06105 [candidate division WOR-1 bacterium RIFOXYB2_FULL_36_35]OGC16377.1 MAG: hypothetical protein A2282_00450 [candidate division WOR-1 bacterium RIFOXYA12_FULL_36_13]